MIHPNICPMCASTRLSLFLMDLKDILYGKDEGVYNLWLCNECGIIFTFPIPSDLISIYPPDEYYSFQVKKGGLKSKVKKYIKNPIKLANAIMVKIIVNIEQLFFHRSEIVIKGGNLLDVGCGYGEFLMRMKKKGMNVYGVDPALRELSYSKKCDIDIRNTTLDNACFSDNFFDVVTLNHSLEHIQDPINTVKEIAKITKPGGFIIVQLPNWNCIMQKIFKGKWIHWDIPRHLFHFNFYTLQKFFESYDFQVCKKRYLYSGYGFSLSLDSFLNTFRKRKVLLKDSSLPNNIIVRFFGLLLFGFLLTKIFKNGDVVEIIFHKPSTLSLK